MRKNLNYDLKSKRNDIIWAGAIPLMSLDKYSESSLTSTLNSSVIVSGIGVCLFITRVMIKIKVHQIIIQKQNKSQLKAKRR